MSDMFSSLTRIMDSTPDDLATRLQKYADDDAALGEEFFFATTQEQRDEILARKKVLDEKGLAACQELVDLWDEQDSKEPTNE